MLRSTSITDRCAAGLGRSETGVPAEMDVFHHQSEATLHWCSGGVKICRSKLTLSREEARTARVEIV